MRLCWLCPPGCGSGSRRLQDDCLKSHQPQLRQAVTFKHRHRLPHPHGTVLPDQEHGKGDVLFGSEEQLEHHQGIDIAQLLVEKRPRQGADALKAVALPAADAGGVGAHHQVELHRLKAQPPSSLQVVLAEAAADPLPAGVFGYYVASVGHMGAEGQGIRPQGIGAHQGPGRIHGHHHRPVLLLPRLTCLGFRDGRVIGEGFAGAEHRLQQGLPHRPVGFLVGADL